MECGVLLHQPELVLNPVFLTPGAVAVGTFHMIILAPIPRILSEEKKESGSERRKTVLVVDDNRDMTEMLKDSLEGLYDVISASNGKEALKTARQQHPDIILTDLMMPVMNGMELCRALKEDRETVDTPIIIITAKHDLGVKLEGLTIGADDYITKPFNLDVLRLRMRRLIELLLYLE